MEMLCLYFEIQQPYTLDGKLAIMRDKEIIDNKFYEWANVLKSFGNEAVHTSEQFSRKDAEDIVNFGLKYNIDIIALSFTR
jgi:pyruvate kinase